MNKLAYLALALSACTTSQGDTGLVLDRAEADSVAGTFERDGVTVQFELSRDGARHVAAFHDADGRGLMTTTLEGAMQTSNTIAGDAAASDELGARPEAALVPSLYDALADHGVDPDLLDPQPTKTQGVYDNGDGYFVFYPGESMNFWSASGWRHTYIGMKNEWPAWGACAAITATPYSAGSAMVVVSYPGWENAVRPYWWGALFRVTNAAGAQWWPGGHYCQPTPVKVTVMNWY
jgi:hypothetical protein